jgi:hypothetical protein
MVKTRLLGLLPKVKSQTSRKLSSGKCNLAPHKETPKLMWMLKELSCERVEFNVSKHKLCNDI